MIARETAAPAVAPPSEPLHVASAPAPSPSVPGMTASKKIGLALGILVFALLWFMPISTLGTKGSQAVAIALLTAIWWIFNVMPPAFPALLAGVLYLILNVTGPAEAFAGFFSPSIWMLLFALVMAKGVDKSGLGKRVAAVLLSKAALSYEGVVGVFIGLCVLFPFVIPSGAAIVALLMALAVGTMDALGIEREPKSQVSTGLTCFIGVLALTMARVPMTGSLANFIVTGLIYDLTGVSVTWTEWLANMWVMVPLPVIVTYFYITRRYRPEKALSREVLREQVQRNLKSLGPVSANEWRTMALVGSAVVMWVCQSWMPLNSNQIGILIGMLFLLPYVGFLTMADFKSLPWDAFIFAGGSYSMGVVLTNTGFAQWAASGITSIPFLSGASFLVAGMFVILFAFVVHLLLETMGEVSLLAPIVVKSGLLPPQAVSMLLPYGAGLYVFPFQGAPIILSLGFGTTGWSDVVRYALVMTAVGLVQAALFLGAYWGFTMA